VHVLLLVGVPVLALTGTADASTQKTIVEELLLSASTTQIFLSPNRVNLKFSVTKVKKQDMMQQLEWVTSKLIFKHTKFAL